MNPILSLLSGGASGNSRSALFARALAAMSRGESAESFMADLAKTDSRFQGLDFKNLGATANKLANDKGKNLKDLAQEVSDEVIGLS